MKTVLLDDELYAFLLGHTQEIGESASSIIRRLVNMPTKNGGHIESSTATAEVFDFLAEPEKMAHFNKAEKFLYILSWAYKRDPEKFKGVTLVRGNRRLYFSESEEELRNTGKSTNPRRIPESPYWTITNNSTVKKQEILATVFKILGFQPADIQRMLAEF